MNPIRNAVTNYIETRHVEGNRKRGDELGKLEPRIPVSQIGHCPRQAIMEAVRYHPDHPLHAEPTHSFDVYVKEIMEAGNVWEHQTGKALAEQFDGVVHWERDDPALRVRNDVWSGHIDFLIEECDHYPAGAIIEHKATNPVNFQRKDRLPYPFHCMQVLMYRRLLQQKLQSDYIIPTYLYYRSWSHWAEIQVWEYDDGIEWEGEINGRTKSGEFDICMDDTVRELQDYWLRQVLPPRYRTPTTVKFSCAKVRKGQAWPDCRYFGTCWPELPQEGPFTPTWE